jgi:hypothetical protein
MTFISPHRGSQAPAVLESRLPPPRPIGLTPARGRRGEMFFFFLSLFAARPPELAPIVQSAEQRGPRAKIGRPRE